MDRTAYLTTIHQHLKTAYLLSDEKAAAMIPVFVTTLRAHIDRLAELAASGDQHQLNRASHAVKGALLNMGLSDLAETTHTLEKQCQAGAPPVEYQALITQLQATVALLGEDR